MCAHLSMSFVYLSYGWDVKQPVNRQAWESGEFGGGGMAVGVIKKKQQTYI